MLYQQQIVCKYNFHNYNTTIISCKNICLHCHFMVTSNMAKSFQQAIFFYWKDTYKISHILISILLLFDVKLTYIPITFLHNYHTPFWYEHFKFKIFLQSLFRAINQLLKLVKSFGDWCKFQHLSPEVHFVKKP